MRKKREFSSEIIIGFIITSLILSIITMVLINKGYLYFDDYHVDRSIDFAYSVFPYSVQQECNKIARTYDLELGNYKISGNLSWIKEYYRDNQEFSGHATYEIKKSIIPFLIPNELIITNFTFERYGSYGTVNIDKPKDATSNILLIHSHPNNSENFCRFSSGRDYSWSGDMGTFESMLNINPHVINMVVCSYINKTSVTAITTDDLCGKTYVLSIG